MCACNELTLYEQDDVLFCTVEGNEINKVQENERRCKMRLQESVSMGIVEEKTDNDKNFKNKQLIVFIDIKEWLKRIIHCLDGFEYDNLNGFGRDNEMEFGKREENGYV